MKNFLTFGILALLLVHPAAAWAHMTLGPPAASDSIHFRLDDDIRVMVLSPDGFTMATLSTTKLLRVTDVDSGEDIGRVQLEETAQNALAFSADGREVLVGSSESIGGATVGEVIVYNLSARRIMHRLLGPTSPITSVAFSHKGALVVTGCADGTICLWDPVRWKISRTLLASSFPDSSHAAPAITGISWSPDDIWLAVRDADSFRLISVATGTETGAITGNVVSTAFAGGGNTLAESLWYDDSEDVSVAVLRTLRPPGLKLLKSIRVAAISGWYLHGLAPIPQMPLVAGVTDRGFAVWNVTTGKLVNELFTGQIIRSMAISADGSRFGYVDVNGVVNVMPTLVLLTSRPG